MKYMLLIYQDEPSWNALSEAERQQIYLEYRKLRDELQTRGQIVTGSQLQPIATATSVRVRDGKELVTDGPFAETHEQLGGYFLVEARNLDEATAIAARIPSVGRVAVSERRSITGATLPRARVTVSRARPLPPAPARHCRRRGSPPRTRRC